MLFSENWAIVGRFRRLLAILLNGRDTLVQFSPSVRVWEILCEEQPHERQVRKVSRVLRAHFRRIKTAVIGPDLSTRRLLVDRVDIGVGGADVRLKLEGLASLARDLAAPAETARAAA